MVYQPWKIILFFFLFIKKSKNDELKDIITYNGNEDEFKIYIEELNNSLKTENSNIQNYNGIGTSCNNYGEIEYNGYFKNGIFDGFGRKYYYNNRIEYEGFFTNGKYNGKGILYIMEKKNMRDILKMVNMME